MEKTTEWRPGPPLSTVCRCCLAESCYKDISTEYFWMGKREVYSEMLSETFDISISYSQSGGPNSNSRLICELCISRLRDASDFKKQVQECEKTFMQHLDLSQSVIELEIPPTPVEKEVKLEQVKKEKRHSVDDFNNDAANFPDATDFADAHDDDDDDLDDQPLTKLASKLPKKETVDILELLENNKVTVKRKSSNKLKTSPSKKSKSKEKSKTKVVKASASKTSKEAKPQKKKKGFVELVRPVLKWKPKRKYDDHRGNAAIIIQYSNVCPFRWKPGAFTCAFCPLSFGDINGVKDHLIAHPNRVEGVRFVRATDLIKVEISLLRCELCLENMPDLELLKDHLITIHKKPIDNEYGIGVTPFLIHDKKYICTVCKESFEVFSKLNSHMNEHNPKNVCFECGKYFSVETRFKAHIRTHDIGTNFKCTKCNLDFATRILKNNHIAQVHRSAYKFRYRCPYCGDNFKYYSGRVKHLKEVHNNKIEFPCHLCTAVFSMCNLRTKHIKQVHVRHKEFTCTFCSGQFITGAQLRAHMVKHTGERTFQCEFCKKSYARRKTLREHLRIHNNDKRFVCEYCNNAFVQKCSLKSHIKTNHPNAEKI